jgi:RNA 3'-terminal phosphate cyclase (ATP)
VAASAVQEAQRYLAADVPVGEHLADQLLIPLALAGGGSFRTLPVSGHTRTNMEVIREFLPVEITATEVGDGVMEVTVRG